MKTNVNFIPQFKGFGIADGECKKMSKKGEALWLLSDDDYAIFGCPPPANNAPVIGMLFENEPEYHSSDWDYVRALALAGARILFLDYANYSAQMQLCSGLLIPGGFFSSPERYYSDAKNNPEEPLSSRAKAYIGCFRIALEKELPVLGICAGMQIMSAEMGLKLYRSADYFESPYSHRTTQKVAHYVDLTEGTPFRELMSNQWRIAVNSRHHETLAPLRVQQELLGKKELPLDFYAFATDGIPEAVGKMEKGLLGVQWHPENFAAADDKLQLRIFEWLVTKAREKYMASK